MGRRLAGFSLLNMLGIRGLNHLTVLQFNMPPFLSTAGREDEASRADAFEPALSGANDAGRYVLIHGAGHLDVVDAPETETAIREMLRDL